MEKVRKPSIRWIPVHENILIKLWEEYMCAMKNSGTNTHVYQIITEKLTEAGMVVGWKDVRTKVDNLTRKYKEQLKEIQATGRRSSWRYFDQIHRILGDMKCINYTDVQLNHTDEIIVPKEEPIDYEDSPESSNSGISYVTEIHTDAHTQDSAEIPAAKQPKLNKTNTSQLTPFELAMLEVEKDRTDRMEHVALRRLQVMQRMSAENADFHKKILALMKRKQ